MASKLKNLGEVTNDGGYLIGYSPFCAECALTVKDAIGRVFVWQDFDGDLHSCSESLSPYSEEIAPANRVPYSEGYDDAFPIDTYGETDSPMHCDACGTLIRESLTADGVSYVREYCKRSRSKVARLYRSEFRFIFA